MRRINYLFATVLIAILFCACQSKEFNKSEIIEGEYVISNPGDSISPLTKYIKLNTLLPVKWTSHVVGDYPIYMSIDTFSQNLQIRVVGLRPATENKVAFKIETKEGEYFKDTLTIISDSLPAGYPDISILEDNLSDKDNYFHFADFSMGVKGKFHTKPFVFDMNGEIRWYMDLSHFKKWASPIRYTESGTLLLGTGYNIYEYDLMGNLLKQYNIWPYNPHHEILTLDNGNIIVAVDKVDQYIRFEENYVVSKEDFIIEFDTSQNKVVYEWDLRQLLDVDRPFLSGDVKNGDWFHMNAISYSAEDDCLIVSGKHQGVVKVDRDNNLKWIFAPHRGWGKSGVDGDGFETKSYLLTAINSKGEAYSDSIQDGFISGGPEFDWPWSQHATLLRKNGNLMLFDNGQFRYYEPGPNFSRLVEYEINEDEKTVEQEWEYGRARGKELYSAIISDIDLLENGNVLGTFGFLNQQDKHYARLIELSYPDNEVEMEVELVFKDLYGNGQMAWGQIDLLYRSERISFTQ
ncbi:MAG: aryl-sulfate sulfotransferase [Saprospiraceae bacterium]|nr:aryl-sulfate sulfotransferase [Saprospiraceae bacterium]